MPLALTLEQWSWVASCVSAGGILVAVLAFLLQRRDSRVQLQLAMTEYVDGVARTFVEYPELRKYFHEGIELPEPAFALPGGLPWEAIQEERLRAEAVALVLANAMDFILLHLGKLKRSGQGAWENYFAEVYLKSPVFRTCLRTHSTWYCHETKIWLSERQLDTGEVTRSPRP